MIKIMERQKKYRVRPVIKGVRELELIVSLWSKDSCYGPSEEQSKRVDVTVGFPYKGKNGWAGTYLEAIPLSRNHVPAELKEYKLGVSAHFKCYFDEDLHKVTEAEPIRRRLSEQYARRLKAAVYETLRAVAEQL